MDKIIIRNLHIDGIVGIYPQERVKPQPLVLNVTMFADVRPAAATDAIAEAVDYEAVTNRIVAHVQAASDQLLEKLVTDIARLILLEFTAVQKVQLRIEKVDALTAVQSVGIEIERTRTDFS